jgi:MoaA/NifB/PqqE/SkfB family radical SAM enzyme
MFKLTNDAPNTVVIDWLINNICNYKCSYCIPELNAGSNIETPSTEIFKYFKKLEEHFSGQDKILTISGGEPTLYKYFTELVNQICSNFNNWYIEILTNGSRTIKWWETFAKQNEFKNLRVNISFHPEFADANHLLEVCKILHNNIDTSVQILYKPQYKEKCSHFYTELANSELSLFVKYKSIKQFDEDGKTLDYNENDKKELSKYFKTRIDTTRWPIPRNLIINDEAKPFNHIYEIVATQKNSFKGMNCEIGNKRFYIVPSGDVFGATCTTAQKINLGNMYKHTFKPIKNAICQNNWCHCLPDIKIPKYV